MIDGAHIGERKMSQLANQFAAAIAAVFIATVSIGAIVHVPQDTALIAALPAAPLA